MEMSKKLRLSHPTDNIYVSGCFHTHDIVKSGKKKLGTKNVDTFGIFGEGGSERIQED